MCHYVNEWFITNKLSLNAAKTKHLFLHRQSSRYGITLRLPTITFSSIDKKGESFIKFIEATIDGNITWNKYIELVENKTSKLYVYYIVIYII